MVNIHLEIIKEIDKLTFFPYANTQNRFLDDVNYREIILRKFPYVITYHINKNVFKVITILKTL